MKDNKTLQQRTNLPAATIREAVLHIDDGSRAALMALYDGDGNRREVSLAAVAADMGCTVETVQRRIQRALVALMAEANRMHAPVAVEMWLDHIEGTK